MQKLLNIYHLGIKEIRSFFQDTLMLGLTVFAFTGQVYFIATGLPGVLHKAPIAVVDEDKSQLSMRLINSFYPPYFLMPDIIDQNDIDPGMDAGRYSFVLDIPPNFQRDVLAGHKPKVQLNIDATLMEQAFIGNGYIQGIVYDEVDAFIQHHRETKALPIDLETRVRFNPNLDAMWFGTLMEVINNVTLLSIVLTSAALIREREHGTIEHLLVMPLSPFEIMLSKVWSMGLVVLVVATASIVLVVHQLLQVPLEGSLGVFILGMALNLFATTSMGIFLGTVARSMPQMGLLTIITLLPLEMLSGGLTPSESMPELIQNVMKAMPTPHFVALAQAILYRGAGFAIVWQQMIALFIIGGIFFLMALTRFRKTLSAMA